MSETGFVARLHCALVLLTVHVRLRTGGLHALVRGAKRAAVVPERATPDAVERARSLARMVEGVAAVLPLRVRCVEQSIALLIIARRAGIGAEVQFGARALPFAAHAWVEVDGTPVNGNPELLTMFSRFQRPGG